MTLSQLTSLTLNTNFGGIWKGIILTYLTTCTLTYWYIHNRFSTYFVKL